MSTVVLVTSATRASAQDDRFTQGHLRELADRFDRVVMVLDQDRVPEGGPVDQAPPCGAWSGRVGTTEAPLDAVLEYLDANGSGAAVIIDGDVRSVRRAGAVARNHAAPALWWCDRRPADETLRDTVDVVDAVLAPVDETNSGRYLAIGAGIDMRSLPALPIPARPPLRILVLGRPVSNGGLGVPLRALAETRARGIDAHLVLVDSPGASAGAASRATESLIADLMLTQSVEIIDADGPLPLADLLRRCHLVVDISTGPEVDYVALEAMACGRAVPSSSPVLAPLLAGEALPLMFTANDAGSLARCITALADARHDELVALGSRLRERVARLHSLDQWGASIAAVVDTLRKR